MPGKTWPGIGLYSVSDIVDVKAYIAAHPDQMLCKYGARKWGRRYAPELLLGVMSDDEVAGVQSMRDIKPEDRLPAHQIDNLCV